MTKISSINNNYLGNWRYLNKKKKEEVVLSITQEHLEFSIYKDEKIIKEDKISSSRPYFIHKTLIFVEKQKYCIVSATKRRLRFGETQNGIANRFIWQKTFRRK